MTHHTRRAALRKARQEKRMRLLTEEERKLDDKILDNYIRFGGKLKRRIAEAANIKLTWRQRREMRGSSGRSRGKGNMLPKAMRARQPGAGGIKNMASAAALAVAQLLNRRGPRGG